MTDSMTPSPDLPLSFSEITPVWMTKALSGSFPGVKVEGITLDRERFGTSASGRLTVTYADRAGHDDLPEFFYIKGGFNDKWRKRVWMALQQEARFFAELAPEVNLNIPRCYFAGINDSPQGIVILEDLTVRGVSFGNCLIPVKTDTIAAVLEEMAKHHAQWWGNPKLDRYVNWREPQRIYLKYLFRPKHWEELVERESGPQLIEAIGTPETALRSLARLWELMDAQPRTLLHGDPHVGNFFYETDGRPGFDDWQLTFPGSFLHDMSWVIVTSLDMEQRRKHESELIHHYLDVLTAHGINGGSYDDLWLGYRQNMAHAIASYGSLPFDSGPPDIMREAERRVYAAAIDHDVRESLGLPRG